MSEPEHEALNSQLAPPQSGAAPLPARRSPGPWHVFVLTFAVYMAFGALEPADTAGATSAVPHACCSWKWMAAQNWFYPSVYAVKVAVTTAVVVWGVRGWRKLGLLPIRVHPLALIVGVAGVIVWVLLADLQRRLGWVTDLGVRPGYNPFQRLECPMCRWSFLAIRFFGLALLVPVIEEFFLRGFLCRYVMEPDAWWNVPLGKLNRTALAAIILTPILLHPNEALAALAWFSVVTWLMLRTRNIWDCIAAHAVTNVCLGVYVVATGNWYLM